MLIVDNTFQNIFSTKVPEFCEVLIFIFRPDLQPVVVDPPVVLK